MTRTLHTTVFICLLGAGIAAQAQELDGEANIGNAEFTIKEDITDEDIRDFVKKREEYKDDPETLELLDRVQEAAGITEEDIARATGKAPPAQQAAAGERKQATIKGNSNVAEKAYRSRDYETALKHYQALAAEGDAYANLMLGLMYQQGQGVDADMTRAHAYYDRAADYGDDRGSELIDSIEREMSEEEIRQANQQYSEIVKQQKEAGAPPAKPREEREKYPAVIIENDRPTEP